MHLSPSMEEHKGLPRSRYYCVLHRPHLRELQVGHQYSSVCMAVPHRTSNSRDPNMQHAVLLVIAGKCVVVAIDSSVHVVLTKHTPLDEKTIRWSQSWNENMDFPLQVQTAHVHVGHNAERKHQRSRTRRHFEADLLHIRRQCDAVMSENDSCSPPVGNCPWIPGWCRMVNQLYCFFLVKIFVLCLVELLL